MNTNLEDRVYSNYRAVLRSMPHTAGSRAGSRKQRARVLTSERYHLPISQVKSIVHAKDEANNITHEHTVAYQKKLEFDREAQELLSQHGDNPACPHCKEVPTLDIDRVRIWVSPYLAEIEGIIRPILCCTNCYDDLDADI